MDSNPYSNKIYVFKSAGSRHEYIITLEIDLNDESVNTNLNRDNVLDKRYAKFRTNKVYVTKIQHKTTKLEIDEICSHYDKNFIYKVGKIMIDDKYDENINIVMASGIHFYLTEMPAYYCTNIRPLNGIHIEWYDNGILEIEASYANTMRNGLTKTWFPNGQIMREVMYKDDKFDGKSKEWYISGQIKFDKDYKNNRENGVSKYWHPNGVIGIEGNYIDGNEDGIHKAWFENGQIQSETYYRHGIKHGTCKTWYSNGNQHIICAFYDGSLYGSYFSWYEKGTRHIESHYKHDRKCNTFCEWYQNENLKIEIEFDDNGIEKESKEWNEDGRIKESVFTKDGTLYITQITPISATTKYNIVETKPM